MSVVSLEGKFLNRSLRGTLDYLLKLNRSTNVELSIFRLLKPSPELLWRNSWLDFAHGERPFRRGSLQASRATSGRVNSFHDDGESSPLIITTLEILLLQDTPWTISRVAKHAISESRAATLKYLASRRRMARIVGAPTAGVTSNEIEGMKSFVTSFHSLLLLSSRLRFCVVHYSAGKERSILFRRHASWLSLFRSRRFTFILIKLHNNIPLISYFIQNLQFAFLRGIHD